MKKILLTVTKAAGITIHAKFAVRRIVKGNEIEYHPMVKPKGIFADWVPIVKVYDKYIAIPYEVPGGLSNEECINHIRNYKAQLTEEAKRNRIQVDYNEC